MLLISALVLLLGAPLQRPADVVKWTAEAPSPVSAATRTVPVTVKARIEPGWKLYAVQQVAGGPKPLAFSIPEGAPFRTSREQVVAPKAKVLKQDENFATDTHYYEHAAEFTVPVAIDRAAAAGEHEIPLAVTFQACGAQLCLRPFTQQLPVQLTIGK